MADFCKQCADENFPDIGSEFSHDFEGLTTFGDQMVGLYACVLCEGCGSIEVDWLGRRIKERPDIPLDSYFKIVNPDWQFRLHND